LEDCLRREVLGKTGLEISVGEKIGIFKHAYTHFRITVHAWQAKPNSLPLSEVPENCRWVLRDDLADYPMGKVARKISDHLTSNGISL
jgi:A/G-specific adenine glycosylase